MKRVGTIALASAACAVAGAAAWADSSDTYYALSAPRIITVQPAGEDLRRSQASVPAPDAGDDEEIAAPQRQRRIDKPAPTRAARTAPSRPKAAKSEHQELARRKPYSVSPPEPPPPEPEPTGPKRALLSVPPPLTTFTPPATPRPVASAMPAPEAVAPLPASPADDGDDHLPPPGDPRFAPPEPAQ